MVRWSLVRRSRVTLKGGTESLGGGGFRDGGAGLDAYGGYGTAFFGFSSRKWTRAAMQAQEDQPPSIRSK